MLEADESIEVVGTAMDGNFCLKKIEELQPDVVTLDLQMPGMNGIDTLKEIMRRHPLPVIVVSSHSIEGASITFKALGLGAFDFVHQAAGRHRAHGGCGAAADRKNKSGGREQSGAARNVEGTLPRPEKVAAAKFAPPAQPDGRHRNLHRRTAGSGILAGATSPGFSRQQFWSCSTCRKALPTCSPVVSTNCALCE